MKLKNCYFTSDLHIGSDKIARLRGYRDSAHFAKEYIEAHNSIVQDHNCTVILGDVIMSRDALPFLSKLRGTIHIVLGNHDNLKPEDYAPYCKTYPLIHSYSTKLVLTHIPVHQSFFTYKQTWKNVHGHLHSEDILGPDGQPDPFYISACVEKIGIAPVHYNQLLGIPC